MSAQRDGSDSGRAVDKAHYVEKPHAANQIIENIGRVHGGWRLQEPNPDDGERPWEIAVDLDYDSLSTGWEVRLELADDREGSRMAWFTPDQARDVARALVFAAEQTEERRRRDA